MPQWDWCLRAVAGAGALPIPTALAPRFFGGEKAAFEEAPIAGVSVEVGFRGMSYEHRAWQLGGCMAPEVGSKEVVSASEVLAASLGIGNAGASYVTVALSDSVWIPGRVQTWFRCLPSTARHLRKGLMHFPPSEPSWV